MSKGIDRQRIQVPLQSNGTVNFANIQQYKSSATAKMPFLGRDVLTNQDNTYIRDPKRRVFINK